MRNSKQYYEQNYSNLETSEVVIDALEDISAELGIDFETLWEDGCTEQIAPDQLNKMVVKHIIEHVDQDDLEDVYYWGVSSVFIREE